MQTDGKLHSCYVLRPEHGHMSFSTREYYTTNPTECQVSSVEWPSSAECPLSGVECPWTFGVTRRTLDGYSTLGTWHSMVTRHSTLGGIGGVVNTIICGTSNNPAFHVSKQSFLHVLFKQTFDDIAILFKILFRLILKLDSYKIHDLGSAFLKCTLYGMYPSYWHLWLTFLDRV